MKKTQSNHNLRFNFGLPCDPKTKPRNEVTTPQQELFFLHPENTGRTAPFPTPVSSRTNSPTPK